MSLFFLSLSSNEILFMAIFVPLLGLICLTDPFIFLEIGCTPAFENMFIVLGRERESRVGGPYIILI